MKKITLFFALLIALSCLLSCGQPHSEFDHFITVSGDRLMQDNQEYRFISYNIPNLHYIEDNMKFEETNPWRFSNEFEIRDALMSIKQSGGQVARIYTLSVRCPDDPPEIPRHILGPGRFNEDGFQTLDKVLQVANEVGVRIIIPFVDNWKWWGGIAEYAAFRDKDKEAFWTDKQIISDFKKTIEFVLNRKNSSTGVAYKNDKAILAWETGNELSSPMEWTSEIAGYIKSIDANHLVIDGFASSIRNSALYDPNIDIVTTHHYEKNAKEIIQKVRSNCDQTAGKKPYFIGEFGFIDTDGVGNVLDAVIDSQCAGALIWSLRFHNRQGGFYWHSESYGGNLFKAYHWPGFESGAAYDERALVHLMRDKAYEIRQQKVPDRQAPESPALLPINNVAFITWQGSAGAASYDIERAESETRPWQVVGHNLSDADVQYQPLFNDTSIVLGKSYFYRVIANNTAGSSAPSNIEKAPAANHFTLIDECRNWDKTHNLKGTLTLKNDSCRTTKEDAHRFQGSNGDVITYQLDHPIHSIKIYSFFPNDVSPFKVTASNDDDSPIPVQLAQHNYYSGKGEYNYYKPVAFTAELENDKTRLNIQLTTTCQISRIEITYGQKTD